MKIKSLKKFIACFTLACLLLSFLIPCFEDGGFIAATIINKGTAAFTDTTKPTSHGFKIENAEYWDYNENYDKSRIWIDQGGGGNGRGGGSGDDANSIGGNGGIYDEAGGVFGGAAGVGLGTGNTPNVNGKGGGTTGSGVGSGQGGSTGSNIADALRALKQEIEESRAESIAKVLESAFNQSLVAASIAESESIAESIQKKLKQEAIKSNLLPKETAPPETQKVYDMIPNIPQTQQPIKRETIAETYVHMPTADQSAMTTQRQENVRMGIVINKEATTHEVDAVDIIRVNINKNIETIAAPTSSPVENTIAPEEVSEYIDTGFEPADFIKESEVMTETIETQAQQPSTEESKKEETAENEKKDDEEEGKGAKGGEDAEADEDKKGDDGSNESEGNAADKGEFHKEDSGEFAGKKVFELDANGNIGLNPDSMSNISARFVITVLSITLFFIGGVFYIFGTRDKKSKKNYF